MATTVTGEFGVKAVLNSASPYLLRPLTMPDGWQRIRIALRINFQDNGGTVSPGPIMVAGLCSGSAAPFHASNATTNFVGGGTVTGGNWAWTSANRYTIGQYAIHRAGTTNTASSGLTRYATLAGVARRAAWFTDIVKGSPNYTIITTVRSTTALPADVTDTILHRNLTGLVTNVASHGQDTQVVACDESTGTFDHLCIYFNSAVISMYVEDVHVVALA